MNRMILVLSALISVSLGQQSNQAEPIAIVRYENEGVNADGSYQWNFETANGIVAEEQGSIKEVEEGPGPDVQGQVQYTAPDGSPISLSYIANENGFQPQGSHLPTPPPIPDEILKSLEYNAAHPEEDNEEQNRIQRRQAAAAAQSQKNNNRFRY
ncbi:endocuticle structural glycoprotein ABD-4-like [Diorhabda carinulata]|uniref:endocuticle structural glycoprotein ABD-4-like n=1 Tax=Diorhabda carinulata TaxID=1163345 RepID=UPI0025A2086D|nr:endocuticle structural glycoprotein ABD-4-like [Diorhabda carinulata]